MKYLSEKKHLAESPEMLCGIRRMASGGALPPSSSYFVPLSQESSFKPPSFIRYLLHNGSRGSVGRNRTKKCPGFREKKTRFERTKNEKYF